MNKKKHEVPVIRVILVDLEGHFCYSTGDVGVGIGNGSVGGKAEDVAYDNWLDSLE